jgi:hypothetical protein
MRNIIAWIQWTFFVVGLIAAALFAYGSYYLYSDWKRLTSIALTQCARAITAESETIEMNADAQMRLQDLLEREAALKDKTEKVCAKLKK